MSDSAATTDAHTRWRQATRVVQRRLPNGVLLLAPGMETSLAITGPAASLWVLLAEGHSRAEIVDELAVAYDTTAGRVDADLADAWDELIACQLIEPVTR